MAENLKPSEISEILLNQLKDIRQTVGMQTGSGLLSGLAE